MGVDSKLVNVDASEALLWWPAAARDYHSKSKAREAGGEGANLELTIVTILRTPYNTTLSMCNHGPRTAGHLTPVCP